jgi:DNA modification methylase
MTGEKPDTLELIHPDLRHLAIPIELLNEDPENANDHDDASLDSIAWSFQKFGQRKPIVVRREGMVAEAGSGSLSALRRAGWTHLACIICDDDESTAMAYGIADNQTARLAKWNIPQLQINVDTLLKRDYDISGLGWSADELADILAGKAGQLDPGPPPELPDEPDPPKPPPRPEDDPEDDRVTEPPPEPITKAGDMWILGDHRIICGDCRDPGVVAKLLGDDRINVAFTSPPYASQRKYDESSGFKPIHPDEFVDWFEAVQANVRAHLANDGSWFVNIKEHCEDGERHLYVKDLTIAHKRRWGWMFIDELCWVRGGVPGKWANRLKNAWEPVFHFATGSVKLVHDNIKYETEDAISYSPDNPKTHSGFVSGSAGGQPGFALPSNVIEVHSHPVQIADVGGVKHAATFPVGLPLFFIRAFSADGDTIYDPFMGSGTTMIAAEKTKRRARGCEISPRYCDVIVARWEALTGRKAERVAT